MQKIRYSVKFMCCKVVKQDITVTITLCLAGRSRLEKLHETTYIPAWALEVVN